MPDTSNISVGLMGMNMDLASTNLDEKAYLYCLNGKLEDFVGNGFGSLQNDSSNILALSLPTGFKIIGKVMIVEQNRALLMLVNASGLSIIAEYKNCVYVPDADVPSILPCENCNPPALREQSALETTAQIPYCSYNILTSSVCLGFNINNPITIEYKITDCGLNIYFTDNLNDRRFLYFDYKNGNAYDDLVIQKRFLNVSGYDTNNCNAPIYTNILDCNKIKYHPEYTKPCIEFVDVINGGNLKSGVYQAMVAYSDVIGNELTQYSNASNPTPIKTKDITVSTDYNTNLAIKFRILNLDNTNLFSYYNLVIAETIDNFTEFKLVGTFPTYTTEHVYTGIALEKKLSVNDIFYKKPYYKTAKSITKANEYLFFSGLKEFSKLNLQPFAEKVKIYWETIGIEESVYSDPRNVTNYRGYLRDEVYPVGLLFSATNGEELCVVHIPGPSKEYIKSYYNIDVDSIVSTNDVIADTTCDNNPRNKLWEVYNTGNVLGVPHVETKDCMNPQTWEYGDFSYHESTELYPNNPEVWGNLCGKPIRHFKFPDNNVTHIHNGLNDSKKFDDKNLVFPIGIRINNNSVKEMLLDALNAKAITQEQYDSIDSYRVVRGNRVGNKSIEAKGLLYDVWDYDKNNKKYYYSNYPYNDLRPDIYISNNKDTYETPDSKILDGYKNNFRPTGRYTFHSPDVHFTNPKIGSELKLEVLEYGESQGYFNECEDQSRHKFLSTASVILALSTGVAAALSSINKECKSYTKIGNTVTVGLDAGTTYHNTKVISTYDKQTGLPVGVPELVSSVTETTCKGSVYQELNKPGLLSILTLAFNPFGESIRGLQYKITTALIEMEKVKLLIKTLTPYNNFFTQYNSVGKYNNYRLVPNMVGNKRRLIERSAYLDPQIQLISEASSVGLPTTLHFNNWNRESSVYLKIQADHPSKLLSNPEIIDTSRFTLGQVGEYRDINKRYNANISSYYGSIKNYVPNQYGNIYKIDYLETGSCPILVSETDITSVVFGGDTFISRFALKRKMPFFLQSTFKLLDQADIRQQDLGNVGYPNFYITSGGTVGENLGSLSLLDILQPGNIATLFGVDRNRLDTDTKKFFYQRGRIYQYSYGIPYFLVESDVNVDYRHGTDTKDNDFYPRQTDLDYWLQEKNVPITVDNKFNYNNTFSKQNKESFICTNGPTFSIEDCKAEYPFRTIYSEQNENNGSDYDNWLVFKANNYHDFPLSNGKLISADGIEDDKILVRFENTLSIFGAYDLIQTDSSNIQVGTGGIFKSRPKNFSTSTLGYAGTQHRSLLKTEYGHIYADSKRGQVHLLETGGKGLDEISKNGMKNWFKENLPFTISKFFPNITPDELDNNFKGIGLHMSFDKRFNRFLMTKLDYKPLRSDIIYKDREFYIHKDLPDKSVTTTVCAPGYTLQNGICVKETITPAVFVGPAVSFVGTHKEADEYAVMGSVIYTSYIADGTGTFTSITGTNPFWINSPMASHTGPLNRAGIWNSLSNNPIGTWFDVTVRVDVPVTKTYYIGMGADNLTRIKIGCSVIMQMDANNMAINHGSNTQITFKKWHIYPVTLTQGVQYITIGAYNFGSIATFGAEIYNNTSAEIAAATSYGDLNLIYTTASLIGQTINTIGWECPGGCSSPIDNLDGTFSCINTTSVPSTTETVLVPQFEDTLISLKDSRYFCDMGWTVSYNFFTKSWVSFHSFVPNVYIDWLEYFQSSDQLGVWSHGISNGSYQVYNGILQPFVIELISKPQVGKSYITSVNYMLDTVRYHNRVDSFYNDVINFNKAIIYTNKQCSGLLNLVVTNPEDFSAIGKYPRQVKEGIEVETYNSEGLWSINDIFDVTTSQYNNLPFFINNCANSNKSLNNKAVSYVKADLDKSYLRNDFFKVRLINDATSQYNFIFKYLINNTKKSFT